MDVSKSANLFEMICESWKKKEEKKKKNRYSKRVNKFDRGTTVVMWDFTWNFLNLLTINESKLFLTYLWALE